MRAPVTRLHSIVRSAPAGADRVAAVTFLAYPELDAYRLRERADRPLQFMDFGQDVFLEFGDIVAIRHFDLRS